MNFPFVLRSLSCKKRSLFHQADIRHGEGKIDYYAGKTEGGDHKDGGEGEACHANKGTDGNQDETGDGDGDCENDGEEGEANHLEHVSLGG